jgi:cell division transport system permease protein
MTVTSLREQSGAIGLATIWDEGQGVDSVSWSALLSHVFRRAYENLSRSRLTASLTVITIAVALFLLGVFSLLVHNASLAVSQEGGEVMVTVFLKDSVSKDDISQVSATIASLAGDRPVTYTDKAQALSKFKRILGDEAVILEGLEKDNPLPASLDVRPDTSEAAEQLYNKVGTALKGDARVDSIRYSRGIVQQIKTILTILKVGGLVGVVFLLVITGFIIANTIKLALYSHRMEVEIMQLVGARRSSIYAPYVLEGAVQGVLGAVCGLLLVFVVFFLVRGALLKTEVLATVFPYFQFLSFSTVVWILVAGVAVGMSGSFLAVRRFLSEA